MPTNFSKLISLYCVLFVLQFSFAQATDYSNLQAILIVGHQEDGTQSAIEDMDEIASVFEEHKIGVHKFYDNEAVWSEIIKVSPECNFLVYSGHGSTLGIDGKTGGICVEPNSVSTATILKELRLKENSLVLFKSVCRGAGSSASDNDDIGIKVAKERVTGYAYPFFEIGAVGYYANNFGSGVYNFLKDFLAGKTLKEAYVNSTSPWTTIEFEEPFPKDSTKSYSIASTPGGGTSTRTTYTNGVKKVEKVPTPKEYEIAYVGNTTFSIKDMPK
ncbi:MAG: hypothetical protein IPM74_07135 [Crocinitomicaceae bacterium]|nr:hypothetical protein [Crocinitomicaceae bacterium]MBK8925673.1 hypothetical protein [Crocinitomicaceae bacterium]